MSIAFSSMARLPVLLSVLMLAAPQPILYGQKYQISYAPNSQEGLLLQLIEQLDGEAKVGQMHAFLERYPTQASVSWIYSYMLNYYSARNDVDKALQAAEKLCALNPDDLEAALTGQKLADQKKNPELSEKWKAIASAAAKKVIDSKKPFQVPARDQVQSLENAGNVLAQGEYLVFQKAIATEQPTERIKLLEDLVSKNPNSPYVEQALMYMMRAHRNAGNNDRALQLAEKILAADPDNDEALLMVAQVNIDRRANYGRVVTVANRLLNLSQSSLAPPGTPKDEWLRRKAYFAGAAYSIIGLVHVYQNQFQMADKALRAALPYVKGNPQAESSTYFYLGWSNYYMENYKDAAQFFRSCLAIPGPLQSQAQRHLEGMVRERRVVQ